MAERRRRVLKPTALSVGNTGGSTISAARVGIPDVSSSAASVLLKDDDNDGKPARVWCQVVIAVVLFVVVMYMIIFDPHSPVQSKMHHSTPNTNTNSDTNSQQLIVSDEDLLATDHHNSARLRRTLTADELRPHIANTEHDIHIVFSSGCSEYQNWQSEVLLYSWARLKHCGQITRIVSGCKSAAERRSALHTAIVSERVHYFFAPDYTPPGSGGGNPFHYFNKPYSMDKWLRETDIAESYIVLIDPDMIITRPFDFHLANNRMGPQYQIKKGHPISQKYGIGPKWLPWNICTVPSCQIDAQTVWNHYSVGPPYMMHIDDWKQISARWVEYSPPALEKDPPPSILAEMYSYAMACAYYDLKHTLIKSMISNPDSPTSEEPWNDIEWDFLTNPQPFLDPGVYILHYCHGYWLGNDRPSGHLQVGGFNFHKGHLPKDILHNCDRSLLVEPPTNEVAMQRDPTTDNKHVWMLYQVVTRINGALANYKHMYCHDWTPQFTTVLRQPERDHKHRMNYQLGDDTPR